jgi:hypothetical protein
MKTTKSRLSEFLSRQPNESGGDQVTRGILLLSIAVMAITLTFPILNAFIEHRLPLAKTSFRHWFYLLTNMALATWLIQLWTQSRIKQEFGYMALYCITQSIYQTQFLGLSNATSVLNFYEAVFGMFLGWSFARSRKELFQFGVPFFLLLPWLWHPSENMLHYFLVPSFYFLGAMSCILQSSHLRERHKLGKSLKIRAERLQHVGALMLIIMCLHILDVYLKTQSELFENLVYHLTHLGLVGILAKTISNEYKENKTKIVEINKQTKSAPSKKAA